MNNSESDIKPTTAACAAALSERHGSFARFTLTYDMTFLVMVLSGLYEPFDLSGEAPCPAHPLGKRAFLQSEISDYAADLNVALAYLNALTIGTMS